jgi:hypothetical protein
VGRVLLVMGHRNFAGGDEPEVERTPKVVNAVERALKAKGHAVHVLQREDGDADPQFTHGDLAAVATRCAHIIQANDLQVMIDAHFQGSPASQSGCFCIFPDAPSVGDGKADNPLDVNVASRLAREVSNVTGIPRLMLSEPGGPGIMSERQTGVGLGGDRLGMFELTLSVRATCVRVIMEHGDIVADRHIIDAPGFYQKVARAYVRTVNALFPLDGEPSDGEFVPFHPHRMLRTHSGAIGRNEPTVTADIVKTYTQGEIVVVDGFAHAENQFGDDRWARVLGTPRRWIHQSGLIDALEL